MPTVNGFPWKYAFALPKLPVVRTAYFPTDSATVSKYACTSDLNFSPHFPVDASNPPNVLFPLISVHVPHVGLCVPVLRRNDYLDLVYPIRQRLPRAHRAARNLLTAYRHARQSARRSRRHRHAQHPRAHRVRIHQHPEGPPQSPRLDLQCRRCCQSLQCRIVALTMHPHPVRVRISRLRLHQQRQGGVASRKDTTGPSTPEATSLPPWYCKALSLADTPRNDILS